jgi:uncharacterized protein
MEEDITLVDSPLSQTVEQDGHTVSVEIYSSGKDDWILEVVDEKGTSTVWDGTFDTDQQAMDEFRRCLDAEGIMSFVMSGK